MDKARRSRLKSVVGQARRVVEEDVRVQVRRLGIDENEIKPVERLPHLSTADKELRQKIIEALEKEKAGDISHGEAFDRYVRHVGFTYVNRIAALRAMEVRNLIKETVIRRDVYGGGSRREYELADRERFSDPYELLKAGLVEAFNEVSAEIRVLFDVNSEYSVVFLGHKALLELIRLLSEEVPEDDWKEDDVIGWIYQYYNEEARAEFKKAKRKPKADDIPVINQFYTPRWVVRVLVDNTLGRLWLEMNGRCPKLGDPVKRTMEQLQNPSGDKVDEFCSYLVPLSQEPPPRERKRVREIKVLDPACGSGHFLVYAFDVLFRMYKKDEPDTSVEEIPRLILENNLCGIDIDLRAVQLAALSLYLKAKSYNPRLKIRKMNLVCADARITDGKVRKVFLQRFADDPELQKIFAKIFEDLEYTYEIGSLLKVREPFEKLLERRKHEVGIQAVLVPKIEGQTAISRSGKIEGQAKLGMEVVKDKEDTQVIAVPREVTLEQMLNALKEFEKEAMEKRDMGTLLFATEAEKSVGVLQLLSQKFDTVLMNPPYGKDMPETTKRYLRKHYPRTHRDYYVAFMEQAMDLTKANGYVGALVGRTFMFLKSYKWVREELLRNKAHPQLVLDLGFGVLDVATARWTAFTARNVDTMTVADESITFFRLTECGGEEDKRRTLKEILLTVQSGREHPLLYRTTLDALAQVPGLPYSYWSSPSLRKIFTSFPPLDRDVAGRPGEVKIADVKQGLATADDPRFTRCFWEVSEEATGQNKKWVPFVDTGHAYYDNIDLVVNWKDNGREIKAYIVKRYPYLKGKWEWVAKNEDYYFREGLTWSAVVSSPLMDMRLLPTASIFGHDSHSVFLADPRFKFSLLALSNSTLFSFLLDLLDPTQHVRNVGAVATLPVSNNALKSKCLFSLASEVYDILREWDTGNEVSAFFIRPWILQALYGFNPKDRPITKHPYAFQFSWSEWESLKKVRSITRIKEMSIRELASLATQRKRIIQSRLEKLQRQIDEEVYRLYEISEEDRKLIERELALRGREPSLREEDEETEEFSEEEQMEEALDTETKIKDHVARLVSFYIKKTLLESGPDGIVPLHQLVEQLRKKLAEDFGEDQVDAKEKEIQEILGKSLEDWVATDYFDFHVNLYKRRPIFWQLTSSNFSTTRGSKGAINIFLHYHKLERETIPKILSDYLKPELESAKWKTERLRRELQEAKEKGNRTKENELSKQLESALSMLEELQIFQKALETVHNPRSDKTKLPKNPTWVQQKIAEVRDNGYTPVIDYGVRVNIEPLKEAGLLHKAAQRVK